MIASATGQRWVWRVLAGLGLLILGPNHSRAETNPVLQQLLEQGIGAHAGQTQRLPPPTMADGLTAEQQRQLIRRLGGRRYPLEHLLRNSSVAPHIFSSSSEPLDAQTVCRRADFWFVAYGDMQRVKKTDFLESWLGQEPREGERSSQPLDASHLAARGITWDNRQQESFGHAVLNLLEKIDLHLTGRTFWTEGADSLTLAAIVDPRFASDAEFPNQWTPSDNPLESHPFQGAGIYLKLTQLQEPPDAVFVEGHLALAEPRAWFDGGNRLASKLGLIVNDQVKSFRRQMMRRAAR